MIHDIILRGGMVIDGSGGRRYRADVAVDGDRITRVGDLSTAAARESIDVAGRIVAPGFIDAHTHDDAALLTAQGLLPKTTQGVTTVVAGNCGISLAPLRFASVAPPPFTLLGGADAYRFEHFADYVRALDDAGSAANAALLVGHSTLRRRVMPTVDRAATAPEIGAMQQLIEHAMADGAFGLSTGLDYEPAQSAPTTELRALAGTTARYGGLYVTHTRNYFEHLESALEEAIDVATHAGTALILSHHQVTGRANFGKGPATMARIDAARRTLDVGVDAYPYSASSTVLRLDRCDTGTRILITSSDPHPELVNRDLAYIANEWDCTEREAALRLMPAGAVYFQLDEADVRCILAHPRTMIGSDGLPHDSHPHPRLWGTFPRVLGHYVREVGLFALEEAVHRMTGLTADEFGIERRGRLVEGHFADLVVFDPAVIADRATFELPRRPSAGIDWVFVNGSPVLIDGVPNWSRPGRVLRPGAAPRQRFGGP